MKNSLKRIKKYYIDINSLSGSAHYTIFVSGATGATGGEVVKQLIEKGASVRAEAHAGQKAGILKELGAEVVAVHLSDIKNIQTVLTDVEKAFSLSAHSFLIVPNWPPISLDE